MTPKCAQDVFPSKQWIRCIAFKGGWAKYNVM